MKDLNITVIPRVSSRPQTGTYDLRVVASKPESKTKSTRITIGQNILNKLGLRVGDEIIFGRVGNSFYVTSPKYLPNERGYLLAKNNDSPSVPAVVNNKVLHSMMTNGSYVIDEEIVKNGTLWIKLEYEGE